MISILVFLLNTNRDGTSQANRTTSGIKDLGQRISFQTLAKLSPYTLRSHSQK